MQASRMVLDEELLAERAKSGDAEAFADLVRLFQGRIRAFFAARLADASMVDDLAQEAFLIAYQKLPQCDTRRPLHPWLKKISLNVFLNANRKRRPHPMAPEDLDATLDRLASEQMDSIEGEAFEDDLVHGLRQCLGNVQTFSRRLLEARYQRGLALKDIARTEGMSPTAVSVTLVRIRQKLRKCLELRLVRTSYAEGAGA